MASSDREASNGLAIDLYRRLLPLIQEQDQKSGAIGYTLRWDDPATTWDSADPSVVWNALGVAPIIQDLFWALESSALEDLNALESLDALTDPFRCPAPLLGQLAACFGYRLAENISDEAKRSALLGLVDAFKRRGVEASFSAFIRLLGFELTSLVPLWKKHIYEADNDYSRTRFATVVVSGAAVGPASTQFFTGRLADTPIKPGTVRFDAGGGIIVRDDNGLLIGPTTESGTIDYTTGDFELNLAAQAVSDVTVTLEKITEEWPYHAARIDLSISISPGGVEVPLVGPDFVSGLLQRIEEVRPIHVLIRVFALVVELEDDFGPAGATDKEACVTEVRYDRDRIPSTMTDGEKRRDFLEQGVKGDEDIMRMSQIVGGTPTVITLVMEDQAKAICAGDLLVLNTTPATSGFPYYA